MEASSDRLLPTSIVLHSLTPEKCILACKERKFYFAGLQTELKTEIVESWKCVCLGRPTPIPLPHCGPFCQNEGGGLTGSVELVEETVETTDFQCWCGNSAPPVNKIVASNQCSNKCPGDASKTCGGTWRMNVYETQGKELENREHQKIKSYTY